MDATQEKMLKAQMEAGTALILIEARARHLDEPMRSRYLKIIADGMALLASSPAPTAPTATAPPPAPPGVGSFGALCNCSMAWVGMGRLIRAASGDCPVPDHEEDASEDP